MSELAEQIEAYLLDRADWVPTREICAVFRLKDDRPLRWVGGTPGLLSEFAISGNRGFKHVCLATETEWDRYYKRIRRHAIGELVSLRRKRARRKDVHTVHHARHWEKDSGQAVMFPS